MAFKNLEKKRERSNCWRYDVSHLQQFAARIFVHVNVFVRSALNSPTAENTDKP